MILSALELGPAAQGARASRFLSSGHSPVLFLPTGLHLLHPLSTEVKFTKYVWRRPHPEGPALGKQSWGVLSPEEPRTAGAWQAVAEGGWPGRAEGHAGRGAVRGCVSVGRASPT